MSYAMIKSMHTEVEEILLNGIFPITLWQNANQVENFKQSAIKQIHLYLYTMIQIFS